MKTILNIIIFILCLSTVVCIHELGHLLVAKACKVFCFEYSIGFGPKIFSKKIKHKKKVLVDGKPVFEARTDGKKVPLREAVEGETAVSLRWLPLGGYVAMAGEDGNMTEDGKVIPKERCLNGVNHFKQICIMLAGIVMNFILSIILFISAAAVPYNAAVTESNAVTVVADSKASEAGLVSGDKILYLYQEYTSLVNKETNEVADSVFFPSSKEDTVINSYQTFIDDKKKNTYNDLKTDCISYAMVDVYAENYRKLFTLPEQFTNLVPTAASTRIIHFVTDKTDSKVGDERWTSVTLNAVENDDTNNNVKYIGFAKLGISATSVRVARTFGQAIAYGFKQFGSLFCELFKSLGSIFTPSGWKNVGGIISVYRMSSMGVTSGQISTFLLLWGFISLNLGCFNLLPFPGLDGWQTLIALIESISRKKVPTKVKGIANTVGLIVLMILAGLLIVKDLVFMF